MMFPILTFVLLVLFSVAWFCFAWHFWEKKPVRIGAVLLAVTLALLACSLNTPDCNARNPETMTSPQTLLHRCPKSEQKRQAELPPAVLENIRDVARRNMRELEKIHQEGNARQ